MDFRQSQPFANYLQSTGWLVYRLSDGTYIYIFKLPLLGCILRIPRPKPPINFKEIDKVAKKHQAILVKIEPDSLSADLHLTEQFKKNGYTFDSWSIEPTNTLIINLTISQDELFKSLKPKWRQYIRFAQKNNVRVFESDDIDVFTKLWQDNASRKGYLVENPQKTKSLWRQFQKEKRAHLIFAKVNNEPIAGSFLIFWKKTCYLWHLAYSGKHPNLRPLYLLVWESIIFAKNRNLKEFDFEGIEDPRLPYTKKFQPTFFKKGFGGSEKLLIGSYVKYYHPVTGSFIKIITKLKPDLPRLIYRLGKND